MKNICLLLLFLGIAYSHTSSDENRVVSLTSDNFDQVLQDSGFLLVNFCVKWSAHCTRLEPEYLEAAKKLADLKSNVTFGTVLDESIHSKYKIESFPTIKLFRRGDSQPLSEYTSGRTAQEIVNWVKRKEGKLITEYIRFKEADKAVTRNNVVAMFLGPNTSQSYQEFAAAAIRFESVIFITSIANEVRQAYSDDLIGESLIVFTNFGEEKNVLTEALTLENITKFIVKHKFLTVMPYNHLTSQKIFLENLDTLVLVIGNDAKGRYAEGVFRSVVPEVKDLIALCLAKTSEGMGARLATNLQIKEGDTPAIVIMQPSKGKRKYVLDKPITAENIVNFVHDFQKGIAKPTLRSEEIPAEPYDHNVRILVTQNHDSVVMDEKKDVLVEYYAPWDGNSKELAQTLDNFAGKYRNVQNLIVAKIDVTANEFLDLEFENYPVLIFYPKNDKKNPVRFEGKKTEEELSEILTKHATVVLSDTEL